MYDALARDVQAATKEVSSLRHRLLFIVNPYTSGQAFSAKTLATRIGTDAVNGGTALSRELLEKTSRQRKLEAGQLLRKIVSEKDEPCLLYRIDVLFEPSLELNPVQLLRKLSRPKTLIVAWGGTASEGTLVYGEPGHPSHERYSSDMAPIITLPSD